MIAGIISAYYPFHKHQIQETLKFWPAILFLIVGVLLICGSMLIADIMDFRMQ